MIDLKTAIGGSSGKPIGGLAWFKNPTVDTPILTVGSTTYLKSGNLSVGEASTYPEAYAAFDPGPLSKWVQPVLNLTANINLSEIVYANGTYKFFASSGFTYSSTDGVNWTSAARVNGGPANAAKLIYANNQYLAIDGYIFYTSPDMLNWTLRTSGLSSSYAAYDVIWIPTLGKYLAAGSTGRTTMSSDGITWTPTIVTALGNVYGLAVSPSGTIIANTSTGAFSSTNGTTWTQITLQSYTPPNNQYTKVVYVNGAFYLPNGVGGFIYKSTTGDQGTWATLPTSAFTSAAGNYISRIEYGNGKLLVAQYSNTAPSSMIWVSSNDGATWTQVYQITGANSVYLRCILYVNNRVIIAHNQTSSPILSPQISFDSAIGLFTKQILSSEITRYMRIK